MKKVKHPAKTVEEVDFVTCDICGETIKQERYEVDEVELKHRKGDCYPEGSWGESFEYDLCGDCFQKRLRPWLSKQGAEPTITKWDW